MSGSTPGKPATTDPSVDEIMASLQRMMQADELNMDLSSVRSGPVIDLEESMLVREAPAFTPPPPAEPVTLATIADMLRSVIADRQPTSVYDGGPTVTDLVRAELKPLLRSWLDANLPSLVEKIVRAELDRAAGRPAP